MNLSRKEFYLASIYQKGLQFNEVLDFTNKDEIEYSALEKYLKKGAELISKQVIAEKLDLIRQRSDEFVHLCPGDSLYPKAFFNLESPPKNLFVKGNVDLLAKESLGIVGSRKLRHSVIEWAEIHLTSFLESYPIAIASGAAQGVDQLAHRIALRKSVPTLAFLPSGFDRLYPHSFKKIANEIVEEGGALVSEYPPEFEVKKYSFHARNRLIAGFSKCLFVMQAERKSGSLITANQARFSGKEVCALPGNPVDSVFFGTNDLIADGATIIRDRDDLVTMFSLGLQGEFCL